MAQIKSVKSMGNYGRIGPQTTKTLQSTGCLYGVYAELRVLSNHWSPRGTNKKNKKTIFSLTQILSSKVLNSFFFCFLILQSPKLGALLSFLSEKRQQLDLFTMVRFNNLCFLLILGFLLSTSESVRFDLPSGQTKCISEDIKSNSMTVGKYSVVNPDEAHPLPDTHKVTVRVILFFQFFCACGILNLIWLRW